MVDGDDPGDATQHGVTDVITGSPKVSGSLPTCGGADDQLVGHEDVERYTWEPGRDQSLKYTAWVFPIYDRALGRTVAVCSEQHMAARLCKKLNEHESAG